MTNDERRKCGVIVFEKGDRICMKFYDRKSGDGIDGKLGVVTEATNQNKIEVELYNDVKLTVTCWQLDHTATPN